MVRMAILSGVLTLAAATASAATILVDLEGHGDHLTIQEGLNAAVSGDTVVVAPGVYSGPLNRDIDFGGRRVKLVSSDGSESTIIDCQSAGRAFAFSNGETRDAVVRDLTVRNGYAVEGGAVRLYEASPAFIGCVFEDNVGEFGGAFYVGRSSETSIEWCEFTDNTAEKYGGAIYAHGSRPYVYECGFTGNSSAISGGAISCKSWTVSSIYNCRFTGNSSLDGGAVYVATLYGWDQWEWDTTRVGFCWFAENTADRGGALLVRAFSQVDVVWSSFVRNSAEQGGAAYCETDAEGSVRFQSCSMLYNNAEYGGGLCSSGFSYYNEVVLEQCLIAFSTEGSSLLRRDYSRVTADLCLAYGNAGGDALYGTRNQFTDPLLCDVYSDDFNLCENSPCRGANNEWGFLVGSYRLVCGECGSQVREASWGSIKALYR
ncbi:MAG: hypothetical protein ABIG03_00915 [Candidatus Eisenbacteria bacterium]